MHMRKRKKRSLGTANRIFRKKHVWKILLPCVLVIAAAAALIWHFGFQERETEIVSSSGSHFPTVSFLLEDGEVVNPLHGYSSEMDVSKYRGAIVSNEGTHTLQAVVNGASDQAELSYVVTDLTGREELETGKLDLSKDEDGNLEGEFLFGDTFRDVGEVMLCLTLSQEGLDDIFYYSRLTRAAATNTEKCIEFAYDFHDMTMDANSESTVSSYLETGSESDDPIRLVTLGSSLDDIMWDGVTLSSVGDITCTICETTENYTSLLLTYTAAYHTEGRDGNARIREFYRVRVASGGIKLLNYERTMDEIFDPENAISESGIELGLDSDDTKLLCDENGNNVAFVENGTLFMYRTQDNTFVRIYPSENDTDQTTTDTAHTITPLSIDEEGNIAFSYTGYIEGGTYEGKVGVLVGDYQASTGAVRENLFLPLSSGEDMAAAQFSGSFYYSRTQDTVTALIDKTLCSIDCESGTSTILASDLESTDCVFDSENGYAAYRADALVVLNLESGEKQTISDPNDGGYFAPFGFLEGDLVCGTAYAEDAGTDTVGNAILPVRQLTILDQSGEELKNWAKDGNYILSASVSGNLVTIRCATKTGKVYTEGETDYITNNTENNETPAEVQTYKASGAGTLVRIALSIEHEESGATLTEAGIDAKRETVSFSAESKTDKNDTSGTCYFVYGYGRLAGVYDTAGSAITAADSLSGVVVSSAGKTIWERGNRDLVHTIEGEDAGKVPEGNTDLSGITAEEICYILYKDHTVLARVGEGHNVLLYGYDRNRLYFTDLVTGAAGSYLYEEADAVFDANGRVFLADE